MCIDSHVSAGTSVFDVRGFGAVGDGVTMDTAAVQAAIDACHGDQGGTVLVPAGKYLIGTLFLKSNVTLDLAPTAVLLGSTNPDDYSASVQRCGFVNETSIDKCLIYAENAENVAITGRGTIDGQGWAFPVRRPDGTLGDRPMLTRFYDCSRVVFESVNLRNAGAWCSHFLRCSNVRVSGVTIHNRVNQNNDGIDLMSTENVRISDCVIICQDDAICFQPMHDDRPCRDIVITNCILSTRWAGIRSGGAHGSIRNVTVSNCVIRDTYGCGIKLQISGNAVMEDMTFTNIAMPNVSCPISLRFGNCHYNNEQRDESQPFGTMRNILFNNIRASVVDEATLRGAVPDLYPGEERQCISICGIPGHPVEGVSLSDVSVTWPGGGTREDAANINAPEHEDLYPEYFMWGVLPAYGLYSRHAKALTLSNVRFELRDRDMRPAVVGDDIDGLEVDGLFADLDDEVNSLIKLRAARRVFAERCRVAGEEQASRPVVLPLE